MAFDEEDGGGAEADAVCAAREDTVCGFVRCEHAGGGAGRFFFHFRSTIVANADTGAQ
jgi:hypothetical protein